jgi:IclR family pca regulon transcriptional regulator
MALTEISQAMRLNKVTALRLLITLERFQFVERSGEQRKFQIGPNAFYIGNGFSPFSKREKTLQIMKGLVLECKHTVTMSVLDGNSVLFIEKLDGIERVKVTVDIGSRVPAYASASGKAILSGSSDSEIRERFGTVKFERFTTQTVSTVGQLLQHIAKVRSRGFALNDEESDTGLCALAVPVKNQGGKYVAALATAFPAGLIKGEERKRVVTKLQAASKEIGELAPEDSYRV